MPDLRAFVADMRESYFVRRFTGVEPGHVGLGLAIGFAVNMYLVGDGWGFGALLDEDISFLIGGGFGWLGTLGFGVFTGSYDRRREDKRTIDKLKEKLAKYETDEKVEKDKGES